MADRTELAELDLCSIVREMEQATRDAVRGFDYTEYTVRRSDDPVTSIDRTIDDRLRNSLPDIVRCAYLSEESQSDAPASGGPIWVVDPIDGTHNLVAGLPEFGVSVALADAATNKAIAAVCVLPRSATVYTAVRGHGATRDGDRLTPVDPSRRRLLVAFGFPAEAYQDVDRALALVHRLMGDRFVFRQSGSAMYDICRVAGGHLLGFVEEGVKLWDFVAADLVATEAGAVSYRAPSGRSYHRAMSFDYAVATSPAALATLTSLFED